MALRASVSTKAATRASRQVAPRRALSVVVRADAAAAPAAAPAKPVWTEPTLNPDTPSPIFGGSTGGLLRKAQVHTGGSKFQRSAAAPCCCGDERNEAGSSSAEAGTMQQLWRGDGDAQGPDHCPKQHLPDRSACLALIERRLRSST